MMSTGNFFTKLFLGFWIVTTAVLGSWMLTAEYFESRPPPHESDSQRPPHAPPHRFILRTVYSLQHLEPAALQTEIERIEREEEVRVFLLDRDNEDILKRSVPAQVITAARALDGGKRRAFLNTPKGRMIAHGIYRREEGPLRAVIVFEQPPPRVLDILGGSPLLRILLAVLVSGVICYGLSRLLTSRLKELQVAARRLANGDLDARLAVRERGGDETDELARDFNSMAGQLQDRIQAQKRLLGDVSHELRSPLARLRIGLALAQEGGPNGSQYLARIEQETERLEDLIGQLLDSQVQDIALDSHIDLVALLTQLCEDAGFEGQADERSVQCNFKLAEAVVATSGDLLHKTFDNLLRNALLHTPPGSTVAVSLEQSDDSYRVMVTDQGPGVPEDELPRIFEAFYRVDTSRQRQSGGYGLGLSIARRCVERHGGSIAASNTGSGLCVCVTLPIPSEPGE